MGGHQGVRGQNGPGNGLRLRGCRVRRENRGCADGRLHAARHPRGERSRVAPERLLQASVNVGSGLEPALVLLT